MKKFLSIVLVLVLSFSCFSMVSFAETNTTEHLTEVPEGYVGIYTVEDLYCVRNDLTANYILMNDIDLTEATAEGGDLDLNGNGWNPIGIFKGIFDGNGYTVKGLRIEINERPSGREYFYKGLFREVGKAGTVKNLTVDGRIDGSSSGTYELNVGGIAAYNSGTIENCTNKVKISIEESGGRADQNYMYIGGITGYNSGTISNCINVENIYGYMSDNYNNSAYSDVLLAGGISGNGSGKINNCINTGKIAAEKNGNYSYCRVAGIGSGTISNCYNTARIVTGTYDKYCYAYGIGYASTCSYSYNIGTVIGHNKYAITDKSTTKCYYLAGVGSGAAVATSLTEAQMKLESMYSGWDFDTVWTMDGRADYPYPELRDVDLVLPEDLLHQHEYASEITTPATHLAEGVETFTCACGDSYTEAIAKLVEHTYNATVIAPTCTEQGYTTYTCECGDTYIDNYVTENGHSHTSEITTQPTHLTEGVKTFTCECGDTYEEPIAKTTDHTYTPEITTQPTHLTEGVTTYTCECGDTYTEAIAKTTEHTYTSEVTKEPTHKEEGVKTFTCECGDSYTEAIAKIQEHLYSRTVTAPTCTEQGYTTYTCECGDTYNVDYVEANGHSYTSEVITPATHLTEGLARLTCHCGDSYTEVVKKTTEHTYTSEVTTQPTHLTEGVKVFTCACGDSYTEAIAKTLEHTFQASKITEPTCEKSGYTTYTCACGDSYKDNFVAEKGHTYSGQICTTCGKKCSCNCHKSGFMGFIWKITLFFSKLFKTKKVCACGVAHY